MSGPINGLRPHPGHHYPGEPGLYGDNSEPPPDGDPANSIDGGFTEEQRQAWEESMEPNRRPKIDGSHWLW